MNIDNSWTGEDGLMVLNEIHNKWKRKNRGGHWPLILCVHHFYFEFGNIYSNNVQYDATKYDIFTCT